MDTTNPKMLTSRSPETNRGVMLRIARKAINGRAAPDGHRPGHYDAAADDKGYIASMINALHRWCVEHNIDWQEELRRAEGLSQEEMKQGSEAGRSGPLPGNC